MYALCSKIVIKGLTFQSIHEVTIKRSIYELGATATIKVPVTAVLMQQGEPPTQIETAQMIKVGDPVGIDIGYDGKLRTEFVGYVKTLNLQTPLEIVCEDKFYTLREKNLTLSGKTTLADIIAKCDLEVGYVADLTIADFPVDNKPASWVLGKLKTDYGLSIWFDMDGKVYASEPYKVRGEGVTYSLRENTINEDDLQYRRADDVKLKIKAVCIYRDGTKIEATIGTGDTEKTIYFYDVENKKELALLAEAELKRHTYDGYSGKITTFLWPYAEPCMLANVNDSYYPQRNGVYFIESTEVTVGTSGGRRVVELGLKI